MIKHELLSLLGTFSKQEIRNFGSFLKSPYLNRNSTILSLFKILKRFYPSFSQEQYTKESIYDELYPGKPYKDATMRNLFFLLLQQALQFLKMQISRQTDLDLQIDLTYKLVHRYLINIAEKNIRRTDLKLSNMKIDWNFFYLKYLLEQSKFNYLEINKPFRKKSEVYKKVQIVEGGIYYLFLGYLYQFISSYIILCIYPNRFESKPNLSNKRLRLNFRYIREISKLYKGKEYTFVMDIFISLMEMFINMKAVDNYVRFKKLFLQNIQKFSKNQIFFLSTIWTCYCIMKNVLYGENETNLKELFNCYRIIVENKYYLNENTKYMHDSLFMGAFKNLLKLRKYESARLFIEKYSNEVQPGIRDDMFNYGMSKYYSEIGEWEKALEFLNKTSLDDFLFKVDLKDINLRAFYSLGYLEESLELIHAYKEFLRKDQVLPNHLKIKYHNFLSIINKLINYRMGKPRLTLDRIKKDLSKTDNILHKEWLTEQLKILKRPLEKTLYKLNKTSEV
jgi:hypothetical protein